MKWLKENLDSTFLLRFALAVIMVMHSVPSFTDMSVLDFGRGMEDWVGPLGIPLAIFIKLTHLLSIPALLLNKYIRPLAVINIIVFVMGIILIHGKNGWYVVGGGSQGIEYNFLLIFSFATFLFPQGLIKPNK